MIPYLLWLFEDFYLQKAKKVRRFVWNLLILNFLTKKFCFKLAFSWIKWIDFDWQSAFYFDLFPIWSSFVIKFLICTGTNLINMSVRHTTQPTDYSHILKHDPITVHLTNLPLSYLFVVVCTTVLHNWSRFGQPVPWGYRENLREHRQEQRRQIKPEGVRWRSK